MQTRRAGGSPRWHRWRSGSGLSAVSAYKLELEGFARTIRNGEPNLCDGEEGLKAATAILKADEAVKQTKILEISQNLYNV